MVNTQLGLFNLIPGYPLDGGRALRAGLWAWTNDFYRATSQAAFVGLVFGLGFGLMGALLIVGALSGTLSSSVASSGGWIVLIGAFLFAAARGSRKQAAVRASLVAVPVRELMVRPVVSLPPDLTLEDAVNRYFLPYGYSGFPVVHDGRLTGLVTVSDVQTIPTSQWASRHVQDVMRPADSHLIVSPDTPTMQAIDRMIQHELDRLIVIQNDQVLGLVTRAAVAHFVGLHQ